MIAATLLIACTAWAVSGVPITARQVLESYDYIIVGGGPGGMTVANRLSEDPSSKLLRPFSTYIEGSND